MRPNWRNSKKITEEVYEEIQKEVERIIALSYKVKDRDGHIYLESLEMHIRSSMHGVGSIMLEKLLNADRGDYGGAGIPCDNGTKKIIWTL